MVAMLWSSLSFVVTASLELLLLTQETNDNVHLD
jgi:hypothetical protein